MSLKATEMHNRIILGKECGFELNSSGRFEPVSEQLSDFFLSSFIIVRIDAIKFKAIEQGKIVSISQLLI